MDSLSVTTIVFLVAIPKYDQLLLEDEIVNRMQEALTLFDLICNSRWKIDSPFKEESTQSIKREREPQAFLALDYLDRYHFGKFICSRFTWTFGGACFKSGIVWRFERDFGTYSEPTWGTYLWNILCML